MRRVLTEDSYEQSNSVEITIDSKGVPKPTVKLYFEEQGEIETVALRVMKAINLILGSWKDGKFDGH